MEQMEMTTMNLPVLALRGLTIFPGCILTFDVEREISIRALERAMESDQQVFLVAQRELAVENPQEGDLYAVGTISNVRQILRLHLLGTDEALVNGVRHLAAQLAARDCLDRLTRKDALALAAAAEQAAREPGKAFSHIVSLASVLERRQRSVRRLRRGTAFCLLLLCVLLGAWTFPGIFSGLPLGAARQQPAALVHKEPLRLEVEICADE